MLDRVPLDGIEYWAQRQTYVTDPELVLRHRVMNYSYTGRWPAGTDNPHWGVPLEIRSFVCHYNEIGFRRNSSRPPFEAVLIGDSFLEIGEGDDRTLSEQVKQNTGLKTFNIGMGFYGPYQYLGVLNRYALPLKPKIIFLCFFRGNDLWDIKEYEQWRKGGSYYDFRLRPNNLVQRYAVATGQSLAFLWNLIFREREQKSNQKDKRPYPYLAIINVGQTTRRITVDIGYGDSPASVEQLVSSPEWISLTKIFKIFKDTCTAHGIRPIVVFIPSKNQVYDPFITTGSGEEMLRERDRQKDSNLNSIQAFERTMVETKLDWINLYPAFERAANSGELLYYPFDSHWNIRGIEVAAEEISRYLRSH